MTGFDWLVVALVPLMAYAGYRLGFLVSTLSFGGFVLGVLLGLAAAPEVIGGLAPGPGRALLAFALVLGAGVVCQAAGSYVGSTVARLAHSPARAARRLGTRHVRRSRGAARGRLARGVGRRQGR